LDKIIVDFDEVESKTHQCLVANGADPWVATEVARAVRYAEQRSNPICGLYYLASYCTQMRTGRVDGKAEPIVSQPRSAAVEVDAGLGFAQPAFARGLATAVESAKTNGTCALAIRRAHTPTALGFFTDQIASAGLLGIGMANAPACVSPPGGFQAVLGTNPIAMSVPARDGGVAFHFDQSTSVVIIGKIRVAAAAGEKIPLGWAVDKDGNATDDPNAALEGSLSSSGGHKGFGFSLMIELLASAVTGSLSSKCAPPLKADKGPAHDLGQFYFLLDPTTFKGDGFFDSLDTLMQAVESQPGARLPGSRQLLTELSIDRVLWDKVEALAAG
jgi:(2R)-3-sulfolactate dehydrogenase (NADP+)